MIVALFILAFFVLFAVYAWTDLSEEMHEQMLDELWADEVGVGWSSPRGLETRTGQTTDAGAFPWPRVTVYARSGGDEAA